MTDSQVKHKIKNNDLIAASKYVSKHSSTGAALGCVRKTCFDFYSIKCLKSAFWSKSTSKIASLNFVDI